MSADCGKLKNSNRHTHKGDFPKFGHNCFLALNYDKISVKGDVGLIKVVCVQKNSNCLLNHAKIERRFIVTTENAQILSKFVANFFRQILLR